MKDENGRFRKLLAEKDYEINFLKKKIEDEKSIIGLGEYYFLLLRDIFISILYLI